jgi:hypothetical protein
MYDSFDVIDSAGQTFEISGDETIFLQAQHLIGDPDELFRFPLTDGHTLDEVEAAVEEVRRFNGHN